MSTMESTARPTTETDEGERQSSESAAPEVEVLVEEISIDGMCGVY